MQPPPAVQARCVDAALGWRDHHEIGGFRCRSRFSAGRQDNRRIRRDAARLIADDMRYAATTSFQPLAARSSGAPPGFSSAHDFPVGATQVATLPLSSRTHAKRAEGPACPHHSRKVATLVSSLSATRGGGREGAKQRQTFHASSRITSPAFDQDRATAAVESSAIGFPSTR